MSIQRIASAGLVALIVLAPLIFVSAQGQEDDDPNDRRYWGYSSRYQSEIDALGSASASIPIPVLGVVVDNLTKNFGDARGDGTRTHQGLDIMAREGTSIMSPTDAIVVRTGNGTNSGIYIRTANPGGENFVYMHLSKVAAGIETGDKVLRGEIIGFVGNTGNASGGPAHLHFELRQGGTAMDPFPRLTQAFTKAEQEKSIADARAKGIVVQAALTEPAAPAPVSPPVRTVPADNAQLVFGETNSDVASLQKFLIASPQGSAGTRLKNTGATGYFGPLTREALIEYQRAVDLSPSGIVDGATHANVFASSIQGSPVYPGDPWIFTRNLEVGMRGEDVKALQIFLNAKGLVIAASGAGSPGQESDYFGARTKAALAKYQTANAIAPAAGYFGPKTRAHIALQ